MRIRISAGAGLVVVAALVTGCSGSGTDAGSPTAPASAPSTGIVSSPSPTPSACPSGTYTITKLVGQGSASALGTGTGGDVMMTFTDGTWQLRSDGARPVELDVGPTTARLTLAGEITGGYTGEPDDLAFTVTEATGTGVVKGFGISKESTMRQIANQLVPAGTTGSVSCAGDQATVTLPTVILTLTRS